MKTRIEDLVFCKKRFELLKEEIDKYYCSNLYLGQDHLRSFLYDLEKFSKEQVKKINCAEIENRSTKKIILELLKCNNLSGFKNGFNVFKKQVYPNIGKDYYYYIKFPKSIKYISSSFINGFFYELKETKGIQWIKERIIIDCNIEDFNNYALDVLD